MSNFVVRGFEARRGFENVLPEPVVFEPESPRVLGWSEGMLRRLDESGIAFPLSVSLCGPVIMPCENGVIAVWYSNDFIWLDDLVITDAAVRVVDALMGGHLVDEPLSYEDKRFLSWFYPMWEDASVNHLSIVEEVTANA